MRDLVLVSILTGIWALAPTFGSPASLWVMPLVAGIAGAWTPRITNAVIASIVSLISLSAL